MKILESKHWFKLARYDDSYAVCFSRLIYTYGLVFKANSNDLGDMHLIHARYRNSLQPLGHFVLH